MIAICIAICGIWIGAGIGAIGIKHERPFFFAMIATIVLAIAMVNI